MPNTERKELPQITLWRGKNIEDLSRDEMIECIKALGRAYQQQLAMPKDYMAMVRNPS